MKKTHTEKVLGFYFQWPQSLLTKKLSFTAHEWTLLCWHEISSRAWFETLRRWLFHLLLCEGFEITGGGGGGGGGGGYVKIKDPKRSLEMFDSKDQAWVAPMIPLEQFGPNRRNNVPTSVYILALLLSPHREPLSATKINYVTIHSFQESSKTWKKWIFGKNISVQNSFIKVHKSSSRTYNPH